MSLIVSGCIINSPAPDPMPLIGPQYGIAPAADTVGEPTPYEVSSMPPEPLYEQMTDSPGDGYVWVDGYWHWNGEEWVWVGGRWEQQQDGYAYVEPYYGYSDGGYYYTPGYWRSQRNMPAGWSMSGSRGNGRPPVLRPPVGWHPTPIASRPGPVGSRPRPITGGGNSGTYLPPGEYPNRPGPYRPSPSRPTESSTSLYPTSGVEHAPPASGRAPEPGEPTHTPPPTAEYPTNSQRSGPIISEHPVYNPPPTAEYPTGGANHAPPPSSGGGTVIYREPTAPRPTSYEPPRQAPPSAPPHAAGGGGGGRSQPSGSRK